MDTERVRMNIKYKANKSANAISILANADDKPKNC